MSASPPLPLQEKTLFGGYTSGPPALRDSHGWGDYLVTTSNPGNREDRGKGKRGKKGGNYNGDRKKETASAAAASTSSIRDTSEVSSDDQADDNDENDSGAPTTTTTTAATTTACRRKRLWQKQRRRRRVDSDPSRAKGHGATDEWESLEQFSWRCCAGDEFTTRTCQRDRAHRIDRTTIGGYKTSSGTSYSCSTDEEFRQSDFNSETNSDETEFSKAGDNNYTPNSSTAAAAANTKSTENCAEHRAEKAEEARSSPSRRHCHERHRGHENDTRVFCPREAVERATTCTENDVEAKLAANAVQVPLPSAAGRRLQSGRVHGCRRGKRLGLWHGGTVLECLNQVCRGGRRTGDAINARISKSVELYEGRGGPVATDSTTDTIRAALIGRDPSGCGPPSPRSGPAPFVHSGAENGRHIAIENTRSTSDLGSVQWAKFPSVHVQEGEDNSPQKALLVASEYDKPHVRQPCSRPSRDDTEVFHGVLPLRAGHRTQQHAGYNPQGNPNARDDMWDLEHTTRWAPGDVAVRCDDRHVAVSLSPCNDSNVGPIPGFRRPESDGCARAMGEHTNAVEGVRGMDNRTRSGGVKPYKLAPPRDWKSWPLHARKMQRNRFDLICSQMTPRELHSALCYWQFFTPQLLSLVNRTGDTVCELTDDDLELLIECGLFKFCKHDPKKTLKMHIYALPENSKRRRRFIVHTIDINDHFASPELNQFPEFMFRTIELTIEETISGQHTVIWTCDATAYYHQFELPKESECFYTFETILGVLCLATIPTGQRHAVGLAQVVSTALLRRAVQRCETSPDFSSTTETYIDNFKCGCATVENAELALEAFLDCAQEWGITINESHVEILSTMKKGIFEYRGIAFNIPKQQVRLSEKTCRKLEQIKTRDMPYQHIWSMDLYESIFGLLIYATAILAANPANYYYVFKFHRRRCRQLTNQLFTRKDHARIWPTIADTNPGGVLDWVETLLRLSTDGRCLIKPIACMIPVLCTDASKKGYGAILFINGSVTWIGGRWSDRGIHSHVIVELEAWAILVGVERLLPNGGPVHFLLDNTSFAYALKKRRSASFILNMIIGKLHARKVQPCSITYINTDWMPSDPVSRGLEIDWSTTTARGQALAQIMAHQPTWLEFV